MFLAFDVYIAVINALVRSKLVTSQRSVKIPPQEHDVQDIKITLEAHPPSLPTNSGQVPGCLMARGARSGLFPEN